MSTTWNHSFGSPPVVGYCPCGKTAASISCGSSVTLLTSMCDKCGGEARAERTNPTPRRWQLP